MLGFFGLDGGLDWFDRSRWSEMLLIEMELIYWDWRDLSFWEKLLFMVWIWNEPWKIIKISANLKSCSLRHCLKLKSPCKFLEIKKKNLFMKPRMDSQTTFPSPPFKKLFLQTSLSISFVSSSLIQLHLIFQRQKYRILKFNFIIFKKYSIN